MKSRGEFADRLYSPLGRMLLALPRGWTEEARESAIVTSLLMFGPILEAVQVRDGVLRRRFTLDVQLFRDAYNACPVSLRPRLMASPVAQFLPPADFHRRFLPTYRQDLTGGDRLRMLGTLEAFLRHHPETAPRYEEVIHGLLRSRSPSLCASGSRMAGAFLRNLAPTEFGRLRNMLASKDSLLRHNAMWALRAFIERSKEVDPAVIAFCTSGPVLRRVETLARSDPNSTHRPIARSLLDALSSVAGRMPTKPVRRRPARGAVKRSG